MRFENIQNEETLEKFFTSRGFEIQEYDKSLIRIDKLHFLQIKIADVLDRDAAYQEHKEFKNKFRDVPYQLLVERTFQKFMFQRDRGTPLRFTYDRTKKYAKETKGSILKKLNLLNYEDSEFNTRINNLFDVKEIVNRFYEDYKRTKNKLAGAITNIDGDPELYAQVILDRIIFLYFLQTKGVLSKTYLSDLFYSKKITENFYRDYLISLFFEGLNAEKHSGEFEDKFGDVPYLNGGLFSPKDMEKKGKIKISDEVWNEVFELLNGYEWVIEEREGDSATLTPSILGHIYEKSVIAATQKETGSYYTPEEITIYISMNTIYPYIQDRIKEKLGVEYEKIFKQLLDKTEHTQEEIKIIKYIYFDILKNLKICDNACGSGAFLIAAQQILTPIYDRCIKALMNLPLFRAEWKRIIRYKNPNYFIKKEIITRNLYGVDIQEGAVEIAKLRLWLSMVSEMELKAEDVEPLPNIDYNILSGNSLIGYIEPEEIEIGEGAFLEEGKPPGQQKIGEEKVKQMKFVTGKSVTEIMKARKELIEAYREERKSEVAREIREDIEGIGKPLRAELNKKFYQKLLGEGIKITEEEFLKLKPFHWGFEFYEVFDPAKPKEERGFDIIIGNPPYLSFTSSKASKDLVSKETLVKLYSQVKDIYLCFLDRNFELIKGDVCYIIPNNVINQSDQEFNRKITFFDNIGEGIFEGAKMTSVCILRYNNQGHDSFFFRNYIGLDNKVSLLGKVKTLNITNFRFNDANPIVSFIENKCKRLEDFGVKITRGEEKGKKSVYRVYDEGIIPVYTANVMEFYRLLNNEYYIKKDEIEKDFYKHEKIGFSISFRNKIKCSYIGSKIVLKSIICIYEVDTKILFWALLFFNSKLFDYYHYLKYSYFFEKRPNTIEDIYKFPLLELEKENSKVVILSKYLILNYSTYLHEIADFLVYELYFKEKFEEDGLKTNLLGLVEHYLRDIENFKTDEEKLEVIEEVVEGIKSDRAIKREIEQIKSHEWVKEIES